MTTEPENKPEGATADALASICRMYGGDYVAERTTSEGPYLAVVDEPRLPGADEDSEAQVCRGAVVDLGDRWVFFDDLVLAAVFARAGRESNLMTSWEMFEAAEVRAPCPDHGRDELVLLVGREIYEKAELDDLVAQFIATVDEPSMQPPSCTLAS